MSNKLFLVCPFSGMEGFIRHKYGNDVFFVTAMAGAFNFQNDEYKSIIQEFIERESINEIIIANDACCRFINNVLNNKKEVKSYAEDVLKKLFSDNYFYNLQDKSLAEQAEALATLNVKHQVHELKNSGLIKSSSFQEVKIKGLVTNKANNLIKEIHFNS